MLVPAPVTGEQGSRRQCGINELETGPDQRALRSKQVEFPFFFLEEVKLVMAPCETSCDFFKRTRRVNRFI
jgi:hypothetical protein